MAKLSDLISRTGADEAFSGMGSAIWYATVIAPAPANVNSPLYVDIPDISFFGETKWGPCRWNKNMLPASGLPQIGDEVLVIFDNRQHPWVVAIWQ